MPQKKKKNLKNAPESIRDHHLVPKKSEVGRHYSIPIEGPPMDMNPIHVTHITTAGKKKKKKA